MNDVFQVIFYFKDQVKNRIFCLALSANSSDDQASTSVEENFASDGSSSVDDDDEQKIVEDELDDFVQPTFWLFVERTQETAPLLAVLQVKFYLYCGWVSY